MVSVDEVLDYWRGMAMDIAIGGDIEPDEVFLSSEALEDWGYDWLKERGVEGEKAKELIREVSKKIGG